MKIKVFPKVYDSNKTQTLTIKLNDTYAEEISVIIQPQEKYAIKHTPIIYRIDEQERYPSIKVKANRNGDFSLEYHFISEQRYCVTVIAGEERASSYVYAVDSDYKKLRPFKGDTHLHTTGSDGAYTPFEVALLYRKSGYDFIAITDHHKMQPSVEAIAKVKTLTSDFTVFQSEEVHNRDMGYFHIVNFGATKSVNEWIEEDQDRTHREVVKVLNSLDKTKIPESADAYAIAYRIMVANKIREFGGIAIMAHPFWDVYGEYNTPTEEVEYVWRHFGYDALEVLASTDKVDNGDNLQVALWEELRAEGLKIPVIGASDFHNLDIYNHFNKHFTLVLSESANDIKQAIKNELSVAVERANDERFFVVGRFRAVKYARFILAEFYPEYVKLCKNHALAMENQDQKAINDVENQIDQYKKQFFGA